MRLLVTALSVAVGVGLLLSVLAMYHAYRDTVAKPVLAVHQRHRRRTARCCGTTARTSTAGSTIDRLDIATLAPADPSCPAWPRCRPPGSTTPRRHSRHCCDASRRRTR